RRRRPFPSRGIVMAEPGPRHRLHRGRLPQRGDRAARPPARGPDSGEPRPATGGGGRGAVGPAPGDNSRRRTHPDVAGRGMSPMTHAGRADQEGCVDEVATMSRVIEVIGTVVDGIEPDQLENPTACDPWTVRDVINHVTTGAELFALCVRDGSANDE